MNIKTLISASRLRTLPLSVSGILVGSAMTYHRGYFESDIFFMALLTTILFQILSNFANDYGDGVKGTDNEYRLGPQRAIQSGKITQQQMKKVIIITSVLSIISAIILIFISFGKEYLWYALFFLFLGIGAVVSAIKYTVGNSAYGYYGLGDLFVFIFFGLVSVVGSYFLYTKSVQWVIFLPAIAIGLLSIAVLNLNNMRDIENDKKSGKNTLVVKIGIEFAKYYHYYLIISAMLLMMLYSIITLQIFWQVIYLVAFIPFSIHLITVRNNKEPQLLDSELKKVALSTFLLSLLFFVGQVL